MARKKGDGIHDPTDEEIRLLASFQELLGAAIEEEGITMAEFTRRFGAMGAGRLLVPGASPTLLTAGRAFEAVGRRLVLSVERIEKKAAG